MPKVLSFLNANPIVVKRLPGMALFPDDRGNIAARSATTLEIEQENAAWEEHHIVLRFSLMEDAELECPVGSLEVVRVSIEHGDTKSVPVSLSSDLAAMKKELKQACAQFSCYQGSHEHGYRMLADIQEVMNAVEESELLFQTAA